MRLLMIAICLTLSCGFAAAQTDPNKDATTGRSPPEEKGRLQPQGGAGPSETKSGGAPAESPQGETPPGMQAAPEGSTRTVVGPPK
jgi:hypothetical protein